MGRRELPLRGVHEMPRGRLLPFQAQPLTHPVDALCPYTAQPQLTTGRTVTGQHLEVLVEHEPPLIPIVEGSSALVDHAQPPAVAAWTRA
jgi:hypothetical protein